jgi:formylglycine-generating enzyme required for sulfatase activity
MHPLPPLCRMRLWSTAALCSLLVGCGWGAPSGEDRDGDGLSDVDEARFGTDPDKRDTDGDGKSDGDEVHVHGTDPSKRDTDGDGVGDGAELSTHHTDPLVVDHVRPPEPAEAAQVPPAPGPDGEPVGQRDPRPRYDGSAAEPPEAARCPAGRRDAYGCYALVPAGRFLMGAQASSEGQPGYDPDAAPDEGPPRWVELPAFWMLRTEVSAALYHACTQEGWCTEADVETRGGYATWAKLEGAPGLSEPINSLTWHGAQRVCGWLGGRLPTEAEWEYAARGTDGRRFPWGNEPGCGLTEAATGAASPAAGGRGGMMKPPCRAPGPVSPSVLAGDSPFGMAGMAGNVWEWVEDAYVPASGAAASGEPRRVQRGGGWTSEEASELRAATRMSMAPEQKMNDVGARCVWGSR